MAGLGSESPSEMPKPLLGISASVDNPPSVSPQANSPPLPLEASVDALTPEQVALLIFNCAHYEDYPTGGPLDQPSGAAGKKRGRKLAPATGDKRREANRAAQRSFRERKVQHLRELEQRVASFEGQQARATQIIHRLIQDNARLRSQVGEAVQTVSELVESIAPVDMGMHRRPSMGTTGSFTSINSPNVSPGSLPDSMSEPTSPALGSPGLPPPNTMQHAFPAPAPSRDVASASTSQQEPEAPSFGLPAHMPSFHQDLYMNGSSSQPTAIPSLTTHGAQGAHPIGGFGGELHPLEAYWRSQAMSHHPAREANHVESHSGAATPIQAANGGGYPNHHSLSSMAPAHNTSSILPPMHHFSSSSSPMSHHALSNSGLGFGHADHGLPPYLDGHQWGAAAVAPCAAGR